MRGTPSQWFLLVIVGGFQLCVLMRFPTRFLLEFSKWTYREVTAKCFLKEGP